MAAPERPGRRPTRAPARRVARPPAVAPGVHGGGRLGDAIADRRRELGLTRRELADRAALSYPFVAQLERGRKAPSTASLSSLATALELTVAELVGAAGEPGALPLPVAADRGGRGPDDPAPTERAVPSLRGRESGGAETELRRFVRDIVRDELAAAEGRRDEGD